MSRVDAVSANDAMPPRISLATLFLKFLRFGALAFGGPVAQIAMIRQALVEEERWISPPRFNRLLAVMQILPGPEAHELCVHMGMVARGRIGGVLAGLGFMLPGFVLMMLCGWGYAAFVAGRLEWLGVFLGVQVVVLAVILRSVVRIGQHIIENSALAIVGLTSFAASLAGVPFWIPLLAGGVSYALAHTPLRVTLMAVGLVAAGAFAHVLTPSASGAMTSGAAAPSAAALFLAGLKGGLLTFGGAYTAIPYVRSDTVGKGWITDAKFLDGIAFAGVLPAPLVIFATFVGYVAGGLPGALSITAGMFLPAFAFSLIFFERLEAVIEHPGLHHALEGVAAAVIGVIAATFVQLAYATSIGVPNPIIGVVLFGAALAVAWRVRGTWVTPTIIAAGAACGWLLLSV